MRAPRRQITGRMSKYLSPWFNDQARAAKLAASLLDQAVASIVEQMQYKLFKLVRLPGTATAEPLGIYLVTFIAMEAVEYREWSNHR